MQNNTGDQIRRTAEVLFVCLIFLTLVMGIAYWAIIRSAGGFLVFLVITGAGILSAFMVRYFYRGFGEIVDHQAEQTQLLLQMTEYLKDHMQNPGGGPAGAVAPGFSAAPPQQAPDIGAGQQQTAEFPTRSMADIECPVCSKHQMANRDSCYACGCRFIYKDEQPPRY